MQPPSNVEPPTSSLFDRLIGSDDPAPPSRLVAVDGETTGVKVTRRQRAKQMSIVRAQIERDLVALLSTRQMSARTNLEAWPLVEASVLNFGIPSLSGTTSSSIDTRKLERTLSRIIKRFEPRLHPESLAVSCRIDSRSCNDVAVTIEALFGPEEALEAFSMSVSLCLSSGQCSRHGASGRAA